MNWSLSIFQIKIDETTFTLSKFKRPEFNGSVKQLFAKPASETLLKRIESGVVAAIGFVNQNASPQYLFYPYVYHDLDGNAVKIVDNASNKKGHFMLMEIDIESNLTYFASIWRTEGPYAAPDIVKGPAPLKKAAFTSTQWKDSDDDTFTAVTAPKIFPMFFWLRGTSRVFVRG